MVEDAYNNEILAITLLLPPPSRLCFIGVNLFVSRITQKLLNQIGWKSHTWAVEKTVRY